MPTGNAYTHTHTHSGKKYSKLAELTRQSSRSRISHGKLHVCVSGGKTAEQPADTSERGKRTEKKSMYERHSRLRFNGREVSRLDISSNVCFVHILMGGLRYRLVWIGVE